MTTVLFIILLIFLIFTTLCIVAAVIVDPKSKTEDLPLVFKGYLFIVGLEVLAYLCLNLLYKMTL